MRMTGPAGDGGSGAIWVLCLVALLTAATTVVVAYGCAVAVRHRADAAADLAALAAAAESAAGPAAACGAAARIATANGAAVQTCLLVADVATVDVTVRGRGRLGAVMVATGHARAGPSKSGRNAPSRAGQR